MSVLFMTRYLGFDKYLMNECKKQVICNPKAKVGSLKRSTKLTNPFPIPSPGQRKGEKGLK